ncbi:hypothetical protein U9M48_038248 [Paspalum notatum var. saurae]|uniref:Uncharacterized protein n=1 Tax=Paspalum notatum var. saurae TaxID=547442 RepID=A0AAQ3UHM1_PASNO
MILRSALRAGRSLRRVPRVQLIAEHDEPCRAPHHRCAAATRSWDVQEPSPASRWGIVPIGRGYGLRSYSAAPARRRKEKPMDEDEDEEVVEEERIRGSGK